MSLAAKASSNKNLGLGRLGARFSRLSALCSFYFVGRLGFRPFVFTLTDFALGFVLELVLFFLLFSQFFLTFFVSVIGCCQDVLSNNN